jgi:hypothetical protein
LTKKILTSFDKQLELLLTDCKRREPEPFWALFDILWAAEVGYIQWCADKQSGKNVTGYENEVGTLVDKLDKLGRREPENCAFAVLLHNYGPNPELDTLQVRSLLLARDIRADYLLSSS